MYARSHPLSIARSTPQTVSVADATVEDFAHPKVLKQELVYFAWARLFTSKPPKGYVWSNKGTLKTYATMPKSMITEAVQLRAHPVIIERPDDPAAGPALIPQAAPHPVVIPRVLHAAGNVHLATQPLASTMLDDAKWCGDASAAVTSSALAVQRRASVWHQRTPCQQCCHRSCRSSRCSHARPCRRTQAQARLLEHGQ